MRTHYLILLCCCFAISTVTSQEILRSTTSASGASSTILQGDRELVIQQSVGQSSVIGTFQTTANYVRQGFIQPPIEIKSINVDESDLDAVVYPNPFSSTITISFNEPVEGTISIYVYDLLGRTVYQKDVQAAERIEVQLEELSTAQYVLLVSTATKQFKANLLKN